MKYIAITILGILTTIVVKSQVYEKPIECQGTIPKDFTTLSQIKAQVEMEAEKKNFKSSSKENRTKEEFISVSNYLTDELLLSGRVLFNDPLSAYLNKIMDNVLVNEKELRDKVRIYVLRSSMVNAFATNNGIIFVTTGLLAEVENEAQLAFILGHEVTHYEKRHVINSFIQNNNIFSSSGNYRYNTYDDRIKAASNYSKDLEYQSDSMAIFRLSRTKYSLDESIKTMDILQFSDLPFDELKFDASFIVKDHYKIPKSFYLDTIKEIDLSRLENENDSKSSHPNLKSRREKLNSYYYLLKLDGGKEKFIQPKEDFLNIQKTARLETIRLLLNDRDYAEAIYEIFILKQKDADNAYLDNSLGKALYGISKYKLTGNYSNITRSWSNYEGEITSCYNFFGLMNKEQITLISCRYLYDLCLKEDKPFFRKIRDDLFADMINELKLDYTNLSGKYKDYITKLEKFNAIEDTTSASKNDTGDTTNTDSKYDKLRKQKEKATVDVESVKIDPQNLEFHYTAFGDLMEDENFKNYMKKMEESAKNNKESLVRGESFREEGVERNYKKEREERDKEASIRKRKGVSLGVDTIIIVDPFYLEVDNRKGLSIVDSEKKLVNFSVDLDELSKQAGLVNQMLSPKLFNENDLKKYNQMSLLNFWAGERLDHNNIRMIPLETEFVDDLIEENGTNKILFSGVYTYREPKHNIGWAIIACIIPYTLPFGIAYLAKPNVHTYYYSLVFDLENGDCNLNETVDFNISDKRGIVKSGVYDLMLQIKREPKN